MGPSESIRWGLGVRVGGTRPHIYFEHGGSALFQCDMVGYPAGDGVVVLTNGGGGGSLSDQIVRSVAQAYGWPDFQPVEHTVVPVDPSKFRRYLGTYDFIKVTQDGSHLMAEIPLGSKRAGVISRVRRTIFSSRCSNACCLRRESGWKCDRAGVHHLLCPLASGQEPVDAYNPPPRRFARPCKKDEFRPVANLQGTFGPAVSLGTAKFDTRR